MDSAGDMSAIWQIMLNNIKDDREMPETAIDLWFGKFKLVSLYPDKVVFATESELKRGIIETKYTDFLAEHTYRVIGFRPEVEITVDTSLAGDGTVAKMRELKAAHDAAEDEEDTDEPSFIFYGDDEETYDDEGEETPVTDTVGAAPAPEVKDSERRVTFNPDYTFENFIVGSSNKLAHAGALAVAENPGRKYNPLFLYGNSGLGKTHLMYAIANKIIEKDPTKKVVYVKGEDFMNQMVESIRIQKNTEFREKYRKADVLLIDDIQYIAGKEGTQMEFFHTFDALYEDHKQIIITSDKPPREMVTLEERIQSRFESGLVVDIQPPDFELRLAILQNKAEQNNLDIPMDVLTFLADKLHSNIRQIEGVIKKLGAKHFLSGMPITIEMVRSSVPEFIRENESESDLVSTIVNTVARRYKTTAEEIYGRRRTKEIKTARNIATYVIRELTTLSLPKIGAVIGNRDYSTVHSNLQAVEKLLKTDPSLEAEVTEIIGEVKKS